MWVLFYLVLLNWCLFCIAKSIDPDQMVPEEYI